MIFYNKYKKFRIENNIDLKDVSRRTKIDLKYLHSIEIAQSIVLTGFFTRSKKRISLKIHKKL